MTRSRGMTLVELLIAMALALILVATAAFIFIESQKIMGKVDTRLRAAQAFRVTSTVLDMDGARLEPTAQLNPGLTMRQLTISGAPGYANRPGADFTQGATAWFRIVQGPPPAAPAGNEARRDMLRMVTHTMIKLTTDLPANGPPQDHTVLVTYRIVPGRGLVREVDPLTVTETSGTVSAVPDDALLPNMAVPGPLVTDLAPTATGFNIRYFSGGQWNAALPAGGATDSGTAFLNAMPTGIEFTVYLPDSTTQADASRLSIVRTVELNAPPP